MPTQLSNPVKLWEQAKKLVPEIESWEPEAWATELKDLGLDITDEEFNLLYAIVILRTNDEFYLDPRVFEKIALAVSGKLILPQAMQEPTPEDMCLAVKLAEVVRQGTDRAMKFPDEDVEAYVAVVLHRNGFPLVPTYLHFAQEDLDEYLDTEGIALKDEVKGIWERLDDVRDKWAELVLEEENPVQVCISKLMRCDLYVRQRVQ